MMTKLFLQALTKYIVGLAIVVALLFIPAGTLSHWQAWLLIGILFIQRVYTAYSLSALPLHLVKIK